MFPRQRCVMAIVSLSSVNQSHNIVHSEFCCHNSMELSDAACEWDCLGNRPRRPKLVLSFIPKSFLSDTVMEVRMKP